MQYQRISPDRVRRLPSLDEIAAERARRLQAKQMHIEQLSIEETRKQCKKLSTFVRLAWPTIEPVHKYIHGWHIDLICDHLEAITYKKFQEKLGIAPRLLINEPPGTMKSSLVNVFWTAWEWGPAGMPSMQNIATSYKEANCARDCEKVGALVKSEWFQKHWPLELPRCGSFYIQTSKRGEYRGIPFGSLTQFRADRVKIDDPHSIDTAESEADRARAILRFRESVPSRVNDPLNSAIILIMQRLHQMDLSGVAIDNNLGYMHINLPMEFEKDNRCVTPFGRDPRKKEGELLFPDRFPRLVVERDKMVMGMYATAGQFQQRPAPREGGMFKREWFKIVPAAPVSIRKHQVRSWDLAGTIPKAGTDPDWTVGLRIGRDIDGMFYIDDVARFRETPQKVRTRIQTLRQHDGDGCHIVIPQDPAQAGKDQAESIIRENAGARIYADKNRGDKATNAEPLAAQCEAGNVCLVKGPWNDTLIDELCNFPTGKDDQLDAASGGFNYLARKPAINISAEVLKMASVPTRRPQLGSVRIRQI